eukprot:2066814-Pyramimonas_sp.AAC.1
MNVNEKLGIALAGAGAGSVTTVVVMKSLPSAKSNGSTSKSRDLQGRAQTFETTYHRVPYTRYCVDVSSVQSINKHTVTREDLGQASWTLLHSMASTYPDNPTSQQKKDVKTFGQSSSM